MWRERAGLCIEREKGMLVPPQMKIQRDASDATAVAISAMLGECTAPLDPGPSRSPSSSSLPPLSPPSLPPLFPVELAGGFVVGGAVEEEGSVGGGVDEDEAGGGGEAVEDEEDDEGGMGVGSRPPVLLCSMPPEEGGGGGVVAVLLLLAPPLFPPMEHAWSVAVCGNDAALSMFVVRERSLTCSGTLVAAAPATSVGMATVMLAWPCALNCTSFTVASSCPEPEAS